MPSLCFIGFFWTSRGQGVLKLEAEIRRRTPFLQPERKEQEVAWSPRGSKTTATQSIQWRDPDRALWTLQVGTRDQRCGWIAPGDDRDISQPGGVQRPLPGSAGLHQWSVQGEAGHHARVREIYIRSQTAIQSKKDQTRWRSAIRANEGQGPSKLLP